MPFYDDTWKRAEETHSKGGSRAFRPSETSALLLWVAPDGIRHCLIACPMTSPSRNERVAKALSISTRKLELEGHGKGNYVDIQCLDAGAHRLFDYLVHDLDACSDVLEALNTTLDEHRLFWSQPSRAFGPQEAVGLFGEVFFMHHWLRKDPVHGFRAWTGAETSLHDFSWAAATVEVKTATGGLPARHKIGTIEQLAWQDGRPLLLFSLAVRRDLGAGTLLTDLITQHAATLAPLGYGAKFHRGVLARGYRPDDPENTSYRYILLDGEGALYEVRDGFPRLTRNAFIDGQLPDGVGGVAYEITLSGCEGYRAGHTPGFDAQKVFGDPIGAEQGR